MELYSDDGHTGAQAHIEAEDAARIRRLAERERPRGTAKLALSGLNARRLGALLDDAQSLLVSQMVEDEALERLVREAPAVRSLIRRASSDGGARLPAWRGVPRAAEAMSALCDMGDGAITRQRFLSFVGSLDAAQALTMAELWAVPQALRLALLKALQGVAEGIVRRGRACAAAERWVKCPVSAPRRDEAFLEYALRRAGEQGLPEARERLESAMAGWGTSSQTAVSLAQASLSRALLRLENLLSARRMLDEMDWRDCFEHLCRVERTLRADPAGVYGQMDDASREAVREQVADIARRLDMPEDVVARHAVDAARTAPERDGGVCWWLYDDEGRRALVDRIGARRVRLRRMIPDPCGLWVMTALAAAAALLVCALTACAGNVWLGLLCAPLGWTTAGAVAARLFPLHFRPARLLKLAMKEVPEACRTLVVMPVLLSGEGRVHDVCDQLEALGCLERDLNIEYLLLGDFADAPEPVMPGDEGILHCARERIKAMNARAGREKYALLQRQRTLLEPDGIWMGRDRKRGALEALNRLLVGEDGAESAFGAEGEACIRLKGRFAYVLTLDADTRMLPTEARRMIGAMAHPLNRPDGTRGYAILQPRMETLPSACANDFAALFSGPGGVNAYPVSASNLWQDMTGRGIYAGKGIYDVAAFHSRLSGALPEGRILSHDLIEGAIAGAGFLGDVALYDGFPGSFASFLKRLNRWIRGDWQLLPLLIAKGPLPNGRRLSAADRFRMLDNLLRSLRAPALLGLFVLAMWTGNGGALLAALIVSYLEPILSLPGKDARLWRRATAELGVLPELAWCALDAILRTLWRLGVSGRRLMEWVPAADAESDGAGVMARVPSRAAALLLIPGMFRPGWTLASLGLAALFCVGPGWIGDMQSAGSRAREALTQRECDALVALARETWRFFEATVPIAGGALPPDNVQLDPPRPAARRTSPTNIALYLLSCLAAHRLGFLDVAGMRARMDSSLDALERAEKWRGHLYNWIDIDTLAPLHPRYVSSVDSGNLAATLLACANARETGEALAARMEALAKGIDFAALYDEERELFAIGMDVEAGRMSASHYDLLASEARILSYVAMMLGQVPTRHWQRLGRPCAGVEGGVAPLSWSGTLFEYLMPLLFMPSPAHTLMGEGVCAAVNAQMALGRRRGRPWGVSESGYGALDASLNYQYRAFGLPSLALSGEAEADVVAPYASALASMVAPRAAERNLAQMRALGWAGEWGMFEAADYRHAAGGEAPAIVKSHMAHHQGMILCALCNALTGDSLRADFMAIPQARALSPLLEERPVEARQRRAAVRSGGATPRVDARVAQSADPDAGVPRTFLLHGDGATALCTSDGAVHYRRFGIDATRFSGDLLVRPDRSCTHLADETGADAVLGGPGSRSRFEPGLALFETRLGGLKAELAIGVSPEDGTLLRVVTLYNSGERSIRCAVTDVVPVALAKAADWQAHAAFEGLFVESSRPSPDALLFRRRPGSRGEGGPVLVHLAVSGSRIEYETDYEKLIGRTGDPGRAGGIAPRLTGSLGATLNPVSALRATFGVAPGETVRAVFALALLDGDADREAWLHRWRAPQRSERALRLAVLRARTALDSIGLGASRQHLLQRLTALLADGRLAAQARESHPGEGASSREALWPLGISGDRPLLLMSVTRVEDGDAARELIRAHAFYRAMGLEVDLALLDDGGSGYARPVRDMLEKLIASSHLNRLRSVAGGVWLLDGDGLPAEQRRALVRGASAAFLSSGGFYAQVRRLLAHVEGARGASPKMMAVGASTLKPQTRIADNGCGGFLPEGGYAVDVLAERLPPSPWCDILANEQGGILLSERGGGFIWQGNSRSGRLTAFGNDALREGWGWMLYLLDAEKGEFLRLLPGKVPQMPFRVRFDARCARYAYETRRAAGEVRLAMAGKGAEVLIDVELENCGLRGETFQLVGFVDWLLGTGSRDAVYLNCWHEDGACLATGACGGVGWFAAADAGSQPGPGRCEFLGRGALMAPEGLDMPTRSEGWTLRVPLTIRRGERRALRLALGWSEDLPSARARLYELRSGSGNAPQDGGNALPLTIETPDAALNCLANSFLLHQVRASRVLGRTGLYQPGGAFGFRDQLQDMLALMREDPGMARAHLLRCAAHQFEAGDVMHWWHEPYTGVRTRISDDMLFLPWVTAAYVKYTGDAGILNEKIDYLEEVEIPAGREDIHCEMRPGSAVETLHGHCMRAFRRAARTGAHGLLRMGAGDWNDGMNRVGAKGRGESVWLTQFAIACAAGYREVAPLEEDRVWLWRLGEELRQAVEAHGWDGAWYLRAYNDDGFPLGGAACEECRIDAICQAWAVLAGLDGARCTMAMDAAWEQLVDEKAGVIRLLTPPFEGRGADPGYIRGYPAGVRENGGQYTHAALWLLLALIRQGDGARAHRALQMLLPYNHADTPEKAQIYRVEPYVMAADVYDRPGSRGRGGWTWYTGAGGWMHTCILEMLGFERRGDRVRLNALLGEWPRASVTVRFGGSVYRLTCEKSAARVTLDGEEVRDSFIQMLDDGRKHEAVFPPRQSTSA